MAIAIDLTNIVITGFEWDKGNREKNSIKHNVTPKECEEIFFNIPLLFFADKKHSQQEFRMVAYGKTDKERKLTAVFTIRENKIRIISARDQHKNERRLYEQAQTDSTL